MIINDDELYTAKDACAALGGSRPIHMATFYRGIREGRYPKPIAIGRQAKRWLGRELRAVHERAIAARDAEGAD